MAGFSFGKIPFRICLFKIFVCLSRMDVRPLVFFVCLSMNGACLSSDVVHFS